MKKFGSQLATGDVVSIWPGDVTTPPCKVRLLIVGRIASQGIHAGDVIDVVDLRGKAHVERRLFKPDAVFHVEGRDTSAPVSEREFNALVGAARTLVEDAPKLLDPARRAYLVDLVDRLDPPKPPTLDEVLQALTTSAKWANLNVDNLDEDDRRACDAAEKEAHAILNRARRAGLLK